MSEGKCHVLHVNMHERHHCTAKVYRTNKLGCFLEIIIAHGRCDQLATLLALKKNQRQGQ